MALVAAGEFEIEEHDAPRMPATRPVDEHLLRISQPKKAVASLNNDSMPFSMTVTTATASVRISLGLLMIVETISTTSSAPVTR
jgi:hypothetical protein